MLLHISFMKGPIAIPWAVQRNQRQCRGEAKAACTHAPWFKEKRAQVPLSINNMKIL